MGKKDAMTLPEALARKWCAYCRGGRPATDHHYHGAIAAAIREALEEAEKVIEQQRHPRWRLAAKCRRAGVTIP